MRKKRSLYDTYQFCSFKPQHKVSGVFGDSNAIVIKLTRQGKKPPAVTAVKYTEPSMTARIGECVIFPAAIGVYTLNLRFAGFSVFAVTR